MRKMIYSLFAAALILICSNAFSQTIVLKALNGTTNLNGESTVAGHTNEIDVLAYSEGISTCPSCKASISEFNFETGFTGSTITFKNLSLNGTKLTSVDVTFIKPGTTPFVFLKIHMESVLVTAVQDAGSSGGGGKPSVSVSLSADRIAWQYTLQKADGTAGTKTSYGWDVANNVPWTFF